MPVLREVGLETTGEGGKTNGSILKALDRKGVDRQEAEYAIRGLALRWRSGRLLGFGPNTPPDLRLLYGKRDASAAATKRPLWPQCVDEYLRHLGSRRKPAPGPVRIKVDVSNG